MTTRFLRIKEVVRRTGLSEMTIWRREHATPPTFPGRVRLGVNTVGWSEAEIEGWCAARIDERDRREKKRTPSPDAEQRLGGQTR